MKTINIKGKEYVPVVERVKEAHIQDAEISIRTEITSDTETSVAVKANVIFKGQLFTGHSQASKVKGMMKDVALEVAETSAIGRALGFANIGLLDGIASADEMRKAACPAEIKVVEDKTEGAIRNSVDDMDIIG